MHDLARTLLCITAAGVIVFFGLEVAGQEGPHAAGNPCKNDMDRLCVDVKPGGGARIQCLKDHENELSQACRAQLAERSQQGHERANKVLQPCGADAKRLCTDVEPGGGGILRCLRSHEADLSGDCRDVLGASGR